MTCKRALKSYMKSTVMQIFKTINKAIELVRRALKTLSVCGTNTVYYSIVALRSMSRSKCLRDIGPSVSSKEIKQSENTECNVNQEPDVVIFSQSQVVHVM